MQKTQPITLLSAARQYGKITSLNLNLLNAAKETEDAVSSIGSSNAEVEKAQKANEFARVLSNPEEFARFLSQKYDEGNMLGDFMKNLIDNLPEEAKDDMRRNL